MSLAEPLVAQEIIVELMEVRLRGLTRAGIIARVLIVAVVGSRPCISLMTPIS